MKHVVSAVAVSAAIAFAAPAWAQNANPASGAAPAPTAPAAAAPAKHSTPPAAYSGPSPRGEHKMESHRATATHGHARTHRMARHGTARTAQASSADNLNRQELSTIQSGGAGAAPPAAAAPAPAAAPRSANRLPGPKTH
jgi:hypothetical protein